AVADPRRHQRFHWPEAYNELRQQRRPGWCDEFVRLVALRHADAARAEDGERGGSRQGKPAVGAVDETRAFDDRRGQHARFAEQFERNGRADDIHDGIDRADFVEMHFLGRQSVNFSFGHGDALEHGEGLLLHPIRKGAWLNQRLYPGEIPSVALVVSAVVMLAVVTMLVSLGM